jgi:flagellin-like hook-associated protein FlgL
LVFNDGSDHTVTLTAGRYTGEALADRIEASLNAVRSGFIVTYDEPGNAFQIQNDTGVSVTFKWSDAAVTAADALGFDAVDSVVAAGSTDSSDFVAGTLDGSIGGLLGYDTTDSVLLNGSGDLSDFEAGMFIDGTNGADAANNRLKLLFGDSGTLVVNDQFEIKDLTIFDTLKNFMDALENNNTTAIRAAVRDMDGALDVVARNLTSVGTFESKIDTLTQERESRETRFAEISSDMIDADLAALIADFNTMLNSYQALMYSIAQTQKLSVMNYM